MRGKLDSSLWGKDARNGEILSMRSYPSPNANVELMELVYWSEGQRVKGLLGMPVQWREIVMRFLSGVAEKVCGERSQLRGMLYLRGGLQSIGMVRPARIAQFAAQQLVVFAPYYRGNRGGEGKDEFVGVDRMDAITAVDVLRRFVGAAPIHVYGFSRGGVMALWTAIERNDIRSLTVWAGVSDVTATYWERVDMRRGLKRIIGGTPNKYPALYDARTPLFEIERIHVPVFIVHGENDQHVLIDHGYKLEQALRNNNKVFETSYAANTPHHYPPKQNREMVKQICKWMEQQEVDYLKDKENCKH